MNTKKFPTYLAVMLFIVAMLAGYFISKTADVEEVADLQETEAPTPKKPPQTLPPNKPLRRGEIKTSDAEKVNIIPAGAIPNERIARFDNDADYQAFLASLVTRGLTLRGSSDALRAVRFGFDTRSNLDDIASVELAYNYIVTPPMPPSGAGVQEGALGFGASALEWLGVTGDHSSWGEGVLIAVIDSGIYDHIALNGGNGTLSSINLTDLGGVDQLGHGTAVASIISGDYAQAPGVAPASDLLSIRITDANGSSDSFTLAAGIMEAIAAGVDLINISMGSYADSSIVHDAVNLALSQGIVIVAAAGNDGIESVAYPGNYTGVITVGGVEAGGEHVDFSNTGENIDITAPGYQINAAYNEESLIAFTGTSASAPFVTGAIAAAMSENNGMSATDAANLVLTLSNDAGYPGDDNEYGGGILALDRIMEHGTSGIYDIAISGQVLSPNSSSEAWITIQNQGTETLINSDVTILNDTRAERYNISSLSPGEIHTYRLAITPPSDEKPVVLNTSVSISESDKDLGNNSQTTELSP